ncbi:MAG: CBS domain-containing protein [Rhodothermales bacterium]|nr:CBS domain-containing protein [Rhodothermales bacterium]
MSTPVSTILKKKGDWVITIPPEATVFETIGRMVDHNIGAICVTQGGGLRGIFTERDYLRRIVLQGRTSKTTKVEEVMTADVVCATPDHTVNECMAMMTEKKCRHLPVLRDGALAGIISLGDCVKALLEESEERIENLTSFIQGGYPG